jgi:hypothetical protein
MSLVCKPDRPRFEELVPASALLDFKSVLLMMKEGHRGH